jgi:Protein of unknown function (DUF2283)
MSDAATIPALRSTYDHAADVLYLTTRPDARARSREEQPGLVWRYSVNDGELIGLTVVDFSTYWGERRPELIGRVAERFSLPARDAQEALDGLG